MSVMNAEQPAAGQDSTASVEDRAAALFGPGGFLGGPSAEQKPKPAQPRPQQLEAAADEQGEQAETNEQEAASDDAPQAPETFEFEIEGEKFVLPKKLEKAVMQERDYTQKSQSLSLREKQIEHIQQQAKVANFRAQFEQEVGPEIEKLRAYDTVLAQEVDWSSMTSDQKIERIALQNQWEKQREALARSIHQKQQQWSDRTDAALKDLAAKSDEIVRQRVPNWNADTWKAISEHAKQDGYSEVEINSINDPRHKLTLWKAQQYDALKAKATKTVVDAKTVKTSPTNPMPQHVKEHLNFRKQIAKTAPNSIERKSAVEARIGRMFAK